MRRCALLVLPLALGLEAGAYPLDASERTGITRLEAARRAQAGEMPGLRLPEGARLASDQIQLRLLDRHELERPPPDAELGRALRQMLGAEAGAYGVALLDLSDPERPVYAEHRGEAHFNPGSVGKLLVGLAILQELADLYPDDPARREAVLRQTRVRADAFILAPSHEVPIWQPGAPRVVRRKLQVGDEANLWSFLDWTLSASSNSAASMTIQQLVLLRHFGREYPVEAERARTFLETTPRKELGSLLVDALQAPSERNGLSRETFRQGGFFTSEGKRRIPGSNSTGTARALVDFLLRLEQGRLVDAHSSLELKRLLYLTDRRIRYASSPALVDAAVYFKSGSLYSCAPEPDFQCAKYHGNVVNMMNSVAIVESPAGSPRLHYLVAVTSNVLRKNSAVVHQTLGTRIHRLIESRHRPSEPDPGTSSQPGP